LFLLYVQNRYIWALKTWWARQNLGSKSLECLSWLRACLCCCL